MDFEYKDFISNSIDSVSSTKAKIVLEDISKQNIEELSSLKTIFTYLENEISAHNIIKQLSFSLLILILVHLLNKIFSNAKSYNAVKYGLSVVLSLSIISPIYRDISLSITYMKDISSFLGIFAPVAGVITASGGNITAAKNQGLTLSITLGVIQLILNYLLPYIVSIFISIAVIDAIWGERRLVSISLFFRNSFFGIFAVSISIIFVIINFYNKAAVGNDTVSAKTLKLLVSNSIPIIGGTIGEALKLLSSGIISARNTIGLTAIVFIFALFLPQIISLWVYSLILNFFGCLCDYFEIIELKGILSHLKCAIDFVLASFSTITILTFINIGTFMNTVPAVIL